MDYCQVCENKEICLKNHWCITCDKQKKYNGQIVCDNFKEKDNK